MAKKKTPKPQKTCGDCIREHACAMWNIGTIHEMNATNCTNHETARECRLPDRQDGGTTADSCGTAHRGCRDGSQMQGLCELLPVRIQLHRVSVQVLGRVRYGLRVRSQRLLPQERKEELTMKKIILCMMAAVAATLMLTGCGADPADKAGAWENPAPTTIVEPVATVATTVTTPATVSVSYPQTPKVAQPVGFRMGDTAWIVLHRDDIGPATAHSAVVIAEIDGYLITAPQYCGNGADLELMWDLILRSDDGRQCLDIWPIGDCYMAQGTAQDVADRENEEAFENA